MDGGDDDDRYPGQETAHEGQQVDEGHERSEEERERHPEDGQADTHDHARDQRGQEVAQHVAGHRTDGLVDHAVQAQRGRRTEKAEEAVPQAWRTPAC